MQNNEVMLWRGNPTERYRLFFLFSKQKGFFGGGRDTNVTSVLNDNTRTTFSVYILSPSSAKVTLIVKAILNDKAVVVFPSIIINNLKQKTVSYHFRKKNPL